VKRSFVAGGVACIPDDSEHAPVRALRVDRHKVTHPHTAPPRHVTANDIIDLACVNVAPWVPFASILDIGEGGLRNVIAREGIIGTLQNRAMVFVDQITDDFLVSAIEVVGVQERVERLLARRTIGVRSSIYIDIHAVRQYFE
jgi:hypothetical protein